MPMKILNSAEMKSIDQKTIQQVGIPGVVLMENAGLQMVKAIEDMQQPTSPMKVAIFCGKGNNGGDGYVVARHLYNRGHKPLIILLARRKEITGDAKINLNIALNMGIELLEAPTHQLWQKQKLPLQSFDLIVDALLGTGLSKPVTGFYKKTIEEINRSGVVVASVDIPSGLSADSSEIIGTAIKAHLTVTFACPKYAHILPPAEGYVGRLVVADISIPKRVIEEEGVRTNLIDEELIRESFPRRKSNTHKGHYGHLLIIAGSEGKTGAACLVGEGALRVGTGLVTVATPESCNHILEVKLTEVMTAPLPETTERTISEKAIEPTHHLLEGKFALAIGPGLSLNSQTQYYIQQTVSSSTLPTIIDADGLNAFAECPDKLTGKGKSLVITPHPGEMARLVKMKPEEIKKDRVGICRCFSQNHHLWVVLKGYRTVISTPEGEVYINPTGNPGMASGGTGDVLTGMIAGLVAQRLPLTYALILGVYLHGLSGDLAAEQVGENYLAAADILDFLPDALLRFEKE
nr:MAG: bifunctional ADP-dependent NAD(P)H-hydrate dehydratase/NAD(P)H-hydrate epimerase [bacterium (candidate division B38) B3_B38]